MSEAGGVLAPSVFNTCMGQVMGKVPHRSRCGAPVDNTRIADLLLANNDLLLVESLEVPVMALEVLHKKTKPCGVKVRWTTNKVQAFRGFMDGKPWFVDACGEETEVLESFT